VEVNLGRLSLCESKFMLAGPAEGGLEDQWEQLREAVDVMALAPDDELLAETMALQSELLQQMLVNRR